jgi:RimJ/RimL family protein N-acetyltransferase
LSILIRKLPAEEYGIYADHLKRLSPADRQSRFSEAVVADEVIEKYVAGISPDDMVIGAFDETDHMVAAVHVGMSGKTAEIGVSVEPSHRDQHVGTELMDHAAKWARNRHADRLYSVYSDSNRSMQGLAHRLGMSITHDHGVAEGVLDLPPADAGTIYDELATDVQGAWHDWAQNIERFQDLWLGTVSLTLKDQAAAEITEEERRTPTPRQ